MAGNQTAVCYVTDSNGAQILDICGDPSNCLELWKQIGSFTVFSAAFSGCCQSRNQRINFDVLNVMKFTKSGLREGLEDLCPVSRIALMGLLIRFVIFVTYLRINGVNSTSSLLEDVFITLTPQDSSPLAIRLLTAMTGRMLRM
jgi:hypothetical protein